MIEASDIIPMLNISFDMVFIDADKSDYLEYLRLMEGNLYKGNVIVADNTNISTVHMRKYLDHMRKSGRYASQEAGK